MEKAVVNIHGGHGYRTYRSNYCVCFCSDDLPGAKPTGTVRQNITDKTEPVESAELEGSDEDELLGDGSCGPNVFWELRKDGTLTIYGSGEMNACVENSYVAGPWNSMRDKIVRVTIEDSVTEIGEAAFYNCINLESIELPSGLTTIGDGAFYKCKSLSSISIPSGVNKIGKGAFAYCSGLTAVTIPEKVSTLEDSVFSFCAALAEVVFPEIPDTEGRTINGDVFYVSHGVVKIEYDAFHGCSSLSAITLPESIREINAGAFCDCTSLTEITIPSRVEMIAESLFSGCTNLSQISLPNNIESIGPYAFENCTALSSVWLPRTVTVISEGAFYHCTKLKKIVYQGSVSKWHRISVAEGNDWMLNAAREYQTFEYTIIP